MGADLVGKVEAGIPEDDPRNPAVIADNVGDNVGDVAGMGADLFESYAGAIIGGMVLGLFYVQGLEAAGTIVMSPLNYVVLPLVLAAVGIPCSIAGTFVVRTSEGKNPQVALNAGTLGAGVLMLAVAIPVNPIALSGSMVKSVRSDGESAWLSASPSASSPNTTRRSRGVPLGKSPRPHRLERPPTSLPDWRWA